MSQLVRIDRRGGIAAYAHRQKAMDRDRPRAAAPAPEAIAVSIRPARVPDAAAMAVVNAEAWAVAYRTIMPDDMLAQATAERFELRWEEMLLEPHPGSFTLVAEDTTLGVIGFLRAGESRQADAPRPHELFAVNIHPRVFRFGIGRRLVEAALREAAARGAVSLGLWVLEPNNRGRFFFKALGAEVVGRGEERLGAITVPKIAYAFDRLAPA